MNTTHDLQFKNDQELEEWFIGCLSADPLPLPNMLAALSRLQSEGRTELAESWSELLQETLSTRGDKAGALDIIELRGTWRTDPDFQPVCKRTLLALFGRTSTGPAFVESAGFDRAGTPVLESMRRFRMLLRLVPGIMCWDKTWGFGVVKSVDGFYKKVAIDFEKKAGHELSLDYAVSILKLLGDDHIRAIKHRNPERLAELVRSDPTEVARMVFHSYGPMNAQQLQETLADGIVPESSWKAFWESARKGLKADPRVVFPASRTDPIVLHETAQGFDDAWFRSFSGQRDLDTVIRLIEDLDAKTVAGLTATSLELLKRHLAYTIDGAGTKRPDIVARALMAIKRLGIGVEQVNPAAQAERFLVPALLTGTACEMPASAVKPFLQYLAEYDGVRARSLFLNVIPDAQTVLLSALMDFLESSGNEKESMEVFRRSFASKTASIEMISWLSRRLDLLESRSIGTTADLIGQALVRLEAPIKGERLKTAKQIRAMFDKKEWLTSVLGPMDEVRRREFLLRFKDSPGWSQIDRNSILAKIITLYPDLHKLLASGEDDAPAIPTSTRFTSWRSYNLRRERLEKIIKGDLPQNGKDLALARSYGDLSENHAFKAAKEHQAQLVNQRDTIAEELKNVRGTGFEGFPADKAGPGTRVVFKLDDGTVREFAILGEWDSDEKANIISCNSALAAALRGHKPGDRVEIPDHAGAVTCSIVETSALPAEILLWARGEDV